MSRRARVNLFRARITILIETLKRPPPKGNLVAEDEVQD